MKLTHWKQRLKNLMQKNKRMKMMNQNKGKVAIKKMIETVQRRMMMRTVVGLVVPMVTVVQVKEDKAPIIMKTAAMEMGGVGKVMVTMETVTMETVPTETKMVMLEVERNKLTIQLI